MRIRRSLAIILSVFLLLGQVGCRTMVRRDPARGLTPPNEPLLAADSQPPSIAERMKVAAAKTFHYGGMAVLAAGYLYYEVWVDDDEDCCEFSSEA